jgi:hypothetical protein
VSDANALADIQRVLQQMRPRLVALATPTVPTAGRPRAVDVTSEWLVDDVIRYLSKLEARARNEGK